MREDDNKKDEKYDAFRITGNNNGNTCLSLTSSGIALNGDDIKGISVEASNATEAGTTIIEETTYAELSSSYEDYSPKEKYAVGDADLDGNISISDVTFIQRYLADYDVKEPIGEEVTRTVTV